MGNPARRFSKARTARRKANWKLDLPGIVECPQCHEPMLFHRVCGNCGYYRGKSVVELNEK